MANPNSRQTLIDYCLRRLGAPVIEINLDEDQIEDKIKKIILKSSLTKNNRVISSKNTKFQSTFVYPSKNAS